MSAWLLVITWAPDTDTACCYMVMDLVMAQSGIMGPNFPTALGSSKVMQIKLFLTTLESPVLPFFISAQTFPILSLPSVYSILAHHRGYCELEGFALCSTGDLWYLMAAGRLQRILNSVCVSVCKRGHTHHQYGEGSWSWDSTLHPEAIGDL